MSASPSPLASVLDKHAELTAELVQALHELGDIRAAQVRAKRDLWDQTGHLGITERRELLGHQTADLTGEIEVLLGEIEALRAQIAHLEWRMRIDHAEA